jgi:hypothetical protein
MLFVSLISSSLFHSLVKELAGGRLAGMNHGFGSDALLSRLLIMLPRELGPKRSHIKKDRIEYNNKNDNQYHLNAQVFSNELL